MVAGHNLMQSQGSEREQLRCFLLYAILTALGSWAQSAEAQRPNIVLFGSDDMGADAGGREYIHQP